MLGWPDAESQHDVAAREHPFLDLEIFLLTWSLFFDLGDLISDLDDLISDLAVWILAWPSESARNDHQTRNSADKCADQVPCLLTVLLFFPLLLPP